jgi:iron(III) transport system substrate-binding protein
VYKNQAYGTTFEPAVFIYNKRLVAADEVPQDHAAFAKLIERSAYRASNG